MIRYLSSYLQPIMMACMLFPIIAAIFTIPFVVRHYRKYGGIAFMRVIVVYSFILYFMCAFLLTVLPLPAMEDVLAMPDHPIGWIPYVSLRHALEESGLTQAGGFSMQALKSFLKSDDFLQCFYNVVMTIPLGIYLRYYFKCGFFKTVFIGFCVSLFFELTQYSALFGIYPKPYRYTEVDDLINNTLGALTGFLIEPVFARLIPGRDEIDRLSYIKGERITFMRRLFAVIIDYVLFNLFFALTEAFFIPVNGVEISTTLIVWSIEMNLYFIVLPVVLKARTPGQALLKLKLTAADGSSATPGMVIKRNILLYVVEFILMQASGTLLSGLVMVLLSWKSNSLKVILLYGAFCVVFVLAVLVFVLRCMRKHDAMPHSYFSHTKEVSY